MSFGQGKQPLAALVVSTRSLLLVFRCKTRTLSFTLARVRSKRADALPAFQIPPIDVLPPPPAPEPAPPPEVPAEPPPPALPKKSASRDSWPAPPPPLDTNANPRWAERRAG